jgi:hypothetical protein
MPGRYDLAMAKAVCEAAENISPWLRNAIEFYLVYSPWVPEYRQRYIDDARQGHIPELTTKKLHDALNPYSISLAVLRERFGSVMAELLKPSSFARVVLPEGVEEDTGVMVN